MTKDRCLAEILSTLSQLGASMTTIEINTTYGLAAVIQGPNSTTFVHPETMRATCVFRAETGIGYRTVVWGASMTVEGWG